MRLVSFHVDHDTGDFGLDRFLMMEVWNGTTDSAYYPLFGVNWDAPSQWVQVQATISLANATHIGFHMDAGAFVGRIYVDNVSIE